MEKTTTANPVFSIEIREVIQKLIDNGHGELIECLMDNEAECYTRKGRLNKSATCRATGLKNKELEDSLQEMRELLKGDFSFID
jgi:hypothetical protein